MPRFFFDLRDGANVTADNEGSEFENVDAAVHAAARSAAEVGVGRLAKRDISDAVIEVRDEQSQRRCTVTASMRIDWHNSPHQGADPWSAQIRLAARITRMVAKLLELGGPNHHVTWTSMAC